MKPAFAWTSHLATHTGLVRSSNEDALAEDPELRLLILADGMGGHPCGEVASGLAVRTVLDAVRELCSGRVQATDKIQVLDVALQMAHERIRDTAERQMECRGMGTTLVACIADASSLVIAHVGDSRLYRLRGGRLQQITRDHSLLQELIDQGQDSREQILRRRPRNRLTRALGIDPDLKIDLIQDSLQSHDLLLLCSDGLSDMLDDREIERLLRENGTLETLSRKLIEAALQAGGIDNVSLALARMEPVPEPTPTSHWQRLARLWR